MVPLQHTHNCMKGGMVTALEVHRIVWVMTPHRGNISRPVWVRVGLGRRTSSIVVHGVYVELEYYKWLSGHIIQFFSWSLKGCSCWAVTVHLEIILGVLLGNLLV